MRLTVLGAAAGGGLPQWNCRAPNSASFWDGAPVHPTATQSSVAVRVTDDAIAVINASPDLRQQILATKLLHPRPDGALRTSPIAAVLLTNGDLDHIAGLLTLREGHAFRLFATPGIQAVLDANPIFDALDRTRVPRTPVTLNRPFALLPGLEATLFAVPGKVPLFMEDQNGTVETEALGEQTVGVALSDGRARAVLVPGCARVTDALLKRIDGADLLMFDGTVWTDDEMRAVGVGTKTGRRMGHMPVSGADGSLAALAGAGVARKVFVHINNTNPLWRDGPERRAAATAGWEIACDGMEIAL